MAVQDDLPAHSPASRTFAPGLPLRFVGGDPSLDFVNTVDWTTRGLEQERIADYPRLVAWAVGARVVKEPQGQMLRQAATARADEAKTAYELARSARWTLHRLFHAVATRQDMSLAEPVSEFNRLLARAHAHLQVRTAPRRGRSGAALRWEWRDAPDDLDCLLWPVVRAAADLLTSPEASRVRVCAGRDCGWLYVDRSRNGLRRWCEMRTCGTLEKARRRAERRRHARAGASRVPASRPGGTGELDG